MHLPSLHSQAFTWCKQAADLKDEMYVLSLRVDTPTVPRRKGRQAQHQSWVHHAWLGGCTGVGGGVRMPCATHAKANEEGRYGFDKNPQEATRLYPA